MKTWIKTGAPAAAVIVAALIGAAIFLKTDSCTVERMMSPWITPDRQSAVDVYIKQCHPRWPRNPGDTREDWVVVLRPIEVLPPRNDRYREADVVFEVVKGAERTQLSFGSPASWIFFKDLPDEEQKTSLVIGCYLSCPASGIQKQLFAWHGRAIHYFRTETPSSPTVTQYPDRQRLSARCGTEDDENCGDEEPLRTFSGAIAVQRCR